MIVLEWRRCEGRLLKLKKVPDREEERGRETEVVERKRERCGQGGKDWLSASFLCFF